MRLNLKSISGNIFYLKIDGEVWAYFLFKPGRYVEQIQTVWIWRNTNWALPMNKGTHGLSENLTYIYLPIRAMQFKFVTNFFILNAYCKNELHEMKNESNECGFGHMPMRVEKVEIWCLNFIFSDNINCHIQMLFREQNLELVPRICLEKDSEHYKFYLPFEIHNK
jgi:hypothetical protein